MGLVCKGGWLGLEVGQLFVIVGCVYCSRMKFWEGFVWICGFGYFAFSTR